MDRSILIASGKGGVGKSTVAARLGMIFASRGIRTLIIDCDAGLSSVDIMLNKSAEAAFSWYDVYLERCGAKDAVLRCEGGPDLIPAPPYALTEPAEDAVQKVVEALKEDYDTVIIDAPAGISTGLIRAANAAKQAIVLSTADEVSVKGAAALERTVREHGITETRLLINRYDLKAAKKGRLLGVDDIIDKTYVQLLGIIPEDREIVFSTVTKTISKKSKSYRALGRIADRIQGKNVPLSLSLLK